MAALSRLIAKELSSALGITDNPKFNPMFKQTDEALSDVEDPNTSTIAEFYSPIESAIENAPIGKKGTRGENIEAFVRKRAPKVTQAELDYRKFNLDPAKKYTRGEDVYPGIVSYTTPTGTTKFVGSGAIDDGMEPLSISALKKEKKNVRQQRQKDLVDHEIEYEEIGIDVVSKDLGLMTHHGGSNLAHARYSVRIPINDITNVGKGKKNVLDKYILIEELQSDAIQNMSKNPEKTIRKALKDLDLTFDGFMEQISYRPEFRDAGSGYERLSEDFKKIVFDKYLPIVSNKKSNMKEINSSLKEMVEDLEYTDPTILISSIQGQLNTSNTLPQIFKAMMAEQLNVYEFIRMNTILDDLTDSVTIYANKVRTTVGKKDLPISSITDSVRVLLQSIIADAKVKGVDEIVLPPIEKLAEKRFPKGSDDYKKAISKGSGFYNTYVESFEKALKQLKGELGNQIKIGKRDLEYDVSEMVESYDDFLKASVYTEKKVLDNVVQGTSINIKDLKLDPKTSRLRLNKGGLVQRPDR